jgi:membrane-bound serine protease (ClpP class)
MIFRDLVAERLADPNVAYLLLVIGAMSLMAEFYNLASFLPGAVGVLALLLAYVALSSLPINWVALFLLILAVGLFVLELHGARLGLVAAVGLLAFFVGSLTLFTPLGAASASAPELRVNVWLVGAVTAAVGAFLILAQAVVKTTRAPAATGAESMMGRVGVAISDLAPNGQARVDSEQWSAVAENAQIRAGEEVRVVGVEGVRLKVRRADERQRLANVGGDRGPELRKRSTSAALSGRPSRRRPG